MRTAVLYSGQARTFAQTFPNQWYQVLRKLPNPTFFVSIQEDEQAPTMMRLQERFELANVFLEVVQQPQIPEPPADPKWLAMYPPSSTPQAILRQLWALNRAWDFFQERAGVIVFDLVVRIRPDLAFARFEMPDMIFPLDCFTPWWARWGGVNDRVAVMGMAAAPHYFKTFLRLQELFEMGFPLHPETLINASLKMGDVTPSHTLATEFCTIRLDGSVVGASITEVDIVEYART